MAIWIWYCKMSKKSLHLILSPPWTLDPTCVVNLVLSSWTLVHEEITENKTRVKSMWWALKRDVCIRVLHGNWTLSIEVHWIDLWLCLTISVVVGMFLLYSLKCSISPLVHGLYQWPSMNSILRKRQHCLEAESWGVINPNFLVWSDRTMVSIDYCILVLSICQLNKPWSEEPHHDYFLNTRPNWICRWKCFEAERLISKSSKLYLPISAWRR